MKRMTALAIALALSAPLTGLAQQQKGQYGQGGSPHCDSLSGAQKDECLKAEGAKTEPKALGDAAAGGSAPSQDQAPQSPRCDALAGAEKDQCLKDEATKTDSQPAK